ncbi:hypothetical protein K438DRAFT_1937275 [Mycena galopus ATCC 62051]|nr:hypothetical protein K438DRAFT_1937275 [Mycena galopus ATCC 62051]
MPTGHRGVYASRYLSPNISIFVGQQLISIKFNDCARSTSRTDSIPSTSTYAGYAGDIDALLLVLGGSAKAVKNRHARTEDVENSMSLLIRYPLEKVNLSEGCSLVIRDSSVACLVINVKVCLLLGPWVRKLTAVVSCIATFWNVLNPCCLGDSNIFRLLSCDGLESAWYDVIEALQLRFGPAPILDEL